MSQRFIRVYQNLDIYDIKKHLLIYGDLSANCANCQTLDIKLNENFCPSCKTEFKYIGFRNIKHHLPKLVKLNAERPSVTLVDYDDFARLLGALKAEEFLK